MCDKYDKYEKRDTTDYVVIDDETGKEVFYGNLSECQQWIYNKCREGYRIKKY